MWQGLISPIANLAGTWLEGRVETKKAQTRVKVAQAEAEATVMMKKATGEMDMEANLTNQMEGSLKDEFWTGVFGAILICSFLPWTQDYVRNGFVFLNLHAPDWFKNCLYICIGSSFGYRVGKAGLATFRKKSK